MLLTLSSVYSINLFYVYYLYFLKKEDEYCSNVNPASMPNGTYLQKAQRIKYQDYNRRETIPFRLPTNNNTLMSHLDMIINNFPQKMLSALKPTPDLCRVEMLQYLCVNLINLFETI